MTPSPCLPSNPAEKMMDPLPQMPQLTRLTRRPVLSETQIPHLASPPQPQQIVPNGKDQVTAPTDAGRSIGHEFSHQTIPAKHDHGDWPLQFQPEQQSFPVQRTPFGSPYQRRPPFLPWNSIPKQTHAEQRRTLPTQVVLPTPALALGSQQAMHEQHLATAMQQRGWQQPPPPYPNVPWVDKNRFPGQIYNPWEPRPCENLNEKEHVPRRHHQQQQQRRHQNQLHRFQHHLQQRQHRQEEQQQQQHHHHQEHQHLQQQQRQHHQQEQQHHRRHQLQQRKQQQQQQIQHQQLLQEQDIQQEQQKQQHQQQMLQLRAQHKSDRQAQYLASDQHEEGRLIKKIIARVRKEEQIHRLRNVRGIQGTEEPVSAIGTQEENAPDIALNETKQTPAVYCELQNDTTQPSDDVEGQKQLTIQQDEIRVQGPDRLPSYKDTFTSRSAKDTFDDGSHVPRIGPVEKDEDSITPNAIPENSDPVETKKDEEPQPKDYDVDEFITLVKDSLDESPKKVDRKRLLPIEEFMILLETSMRENIRLNATETTEESSEEDVILLCSLPIPETPENFTVEPEVVFLSQCYDLREADPPKEEDPEKLCDREVKHGSVECATENVYTVNDSSVSQENIEWLENLIQTTAFTVDCQPSDGEKTDGSPSAPVEEDSVQTTQKIDGANLLPINMNYSETKMDIPNSHFPIDGNTNGITEPTIIAVISPMKVDSIVPTNAIASCTKNLALGSSDQSEGTAFHGNVPSSKVTLQSSDKRNCVNALQPFNYVMRKPLQPEEVWTAPSPTEQTSALSNSPLSKVADRPWEPRKNSASQGNLKASEPGEGNASNSLTTSNSAPLGACRFLQKTERAGKPWFVKHQIGDGTCEENNEARPTEDDIPTPPPDPIPLPKAVLCFVCLETSTQAEEHMYFGLLQCKECSLVISTCHAFRSTLRNAKRCPKGGRHRFTKWTVSPVDFLCYMMRRQLQKEATSGDAVSMKQVVEEMDNYLQALRPLKGRRLYSFAFERCQKYIAREQKVNRKPKFVVRDGAKKQRLK